MKIERLVWELRVALVLVLVSLALYVLHFSFFGDLHHIWLWSFTSLAFLPISVMVVALLINRLLSVREKALRLDKLNMLIGIFFSNVGTKMLAYFSQWDRSAQYLQNHFGSADAWSRIAPREVRRILSQHSYEPTIGTKELSALKLFFADRTDLFLMRLLENPNLLEHESFTELLRAVFHLTEELAYRGDVAGLPDSDVRHLGGDVKRCYRPLIREWINYLRHLKTDYPYLFSLAVRTNPLDRNASPVVE